MQVEFLDLKPAYLELKDELDSLWNHVNLNSQYILGGTLKDFENRFAEYTGCRYAIGVANGLDALILSLKACRLGTGDEVIVPSHTFIATWLAVTAVGATPVPVEPNRETYNIDVEKIEQAITSKTKAILPVHLYGRAAEMSKILELAQKYNLKVIEDAAQSHGSFSCGKHVGALGDVGAFSFYPGKNLGAFGDGGAIVTNDSDLAAMIGKMRNYGSVVRYNHEVCGVNSRLDDIQAGVLAIKLKRLSDWNSRRQAIAAFYLEELMGTPLQLPINDPHHVWHLFVVRTPQRDHLKSYLDGQGIQTIIHYPCPPHLQPAYAHLGFQKGSFPIAEEISDTVLSLPISPHLSMEEAHLVVSKIKSFWK